MGDNQVASYRLVYFQPDPEDGERVCVALLFTAERDVELLYDSSFPKLRCLAPRIDSDLVHIYLDDLKSSSKRNPSEIESLLRRQSSQLVTSEVRKCVWPLTDKSRFYFMKRFLGAESHLAEKIEHSRPQKVDTAKENLRALLQSARVRPEELRENAKSQWVLGTDIRQIKSVAFALKRDNEVILIDGVDLATLKPKSALNQVTKVAHTFWQYRRVEQQGFNWPLLKTIGVVLNGQVNPNAEYKDAHDFALHEFKQEADIAVDASSPNDLKLFQDALVRKLLS